MAKPQKTKAELEALLADRCIQLQILSVVVFKDDQYGWIANFIASPDLLVGLQAPFEAIVLEMRERYDLKS
jgi:hypothetical protein